MTSIILSRKLVSMNVSQKEYEKIKWLRANNLKKEYNAIGALKQIIDKQVTKKTCRLCLRPGNKRLFDKDEFDFVNSIKNILNIQVAENDGKPEHICNACEITLKNVELLKQTAEVTQWRLKQELDMMAGGSDNDCSNDTMNHDGYFVEQTPMVAREWACRKCGRTFGSQVEFSEHAQSSCVNKKCYVCEICGLKLKSMTGLKSHRTIHTSELPHACRQCPYRGRTKYAAAAHERVHGGVAPTLACPHCPATFHNSSNLASHKKKHLPPEFHCQMCDKSFRFKNGLQNHSATQHSTAKPHHCNLCGKVFSTRKMMYRHERKVHNRPKLPPGILPTYLRQQQGVDT